MIQDVKKTFEEKMQKTVNVFNEELHAIRAGRANPQLLDRVVVDYYGSPTPLKSLATIAAPEPRMLTVQPYDVSALKDVEKAIMIADLGLNPSNDGKVIRIAIPILTEERRKDLIKVAKKTGEDAKIAIRNERRDANDKLKKMNKNSEITEDDLKSAEADVQKMTDKYIKQIDDLLVQKEKEIMEV
ncbi:ribosome recycling factor [Acidaminobacter hydrogenoformans]|uniref:Ribosome-recycling factor n=1 Tax=Acidaminobacter hydrogenoformans DSM 2784 TaxID=1120920 RepID=A0A1G5RST7_9FIRM|nr:ribosome recycling factor [Acidaminobacter hydrogenoformans]SCZ76870.1 ribosome recycling factor [Acidaminobacter hydrogenoformans DSM 2784]